MGDDLLIGSTGADFLFGGSGDDVLHLEDFHEIVESDASTTAAYGGAGNDQLYGNSPNAMLYGGTGVDQCWYAIQSGCENRFKLLKSPIQSYSLSDVGVNDINNDGYLDLFTFNNSGRDSVMLGSPQGVFIDGAAELGLYQDNVFPGVEMSAREPPSHLAGLYVVIVDRHLVLTVASDFDQSVAGSVSTVGEVQMELVDLATTEVEEVASGTPLSYSRISFEIQPGGKLVVDTQFVPGPYEFELSESIDIERVFVGSEYVNPNNHKFRFELRDRHGAAWKRSDHDPIYNDVYIVRGGLAGDMGDSPYEYRDEYLIHSNGVYTDYSYTIDLQKENCSARQVTRVDFNQDQRLDLHVSCGRNQNQLLLQALPNGTFRNVAIDIGLDLQSTEPFVWFDTDLDGDIGVSSNDKG